MAQLKSLNKDLAVLTSTYVLNDGLPILYISNDDDDEGGSFWQFHCGNGDYSMEKMLLVSLETILNTNRELGEISLNIGEEATRSSEGQEWTIVKQS